MNVLRDMEPLVQPVEFVVVAVLGRDERGLGVGLHDRRRVPRVGHVGVGDDEVVQSPVAHEVRALRDVGPAARSNRSVLSGPAS